MNDPSVDFTLKIEAGNAAYADELAELAQQWQGELGQWIKQTQQTARQRFGKNATVQLVTAQGRVLTDLAKLSAEELYHVAVTK